MEGIGRKNNRENGNTGKMKEREEKRRKEYGEGMR